MDGHLETENSEQSATQETILNEKLNEIVHHAEMMTGASGAAIALKEGDSLVTHASTGTTAPDVGSRSRIRGSFTGLVIETGEAVRCDDSDNDHRVDPAACRALQTRSIVVVPVKVDNTVAGVLAVFASSPHAFSNVHVSAIKTLAEIAGEIMVKFRPATSAPRRPLSDRAEPHLEINRVSLEAPPVQIVEEAAVVESEPPVLAAVEQPLFAVEDEQPQAPAPIPIDIHKKLEAVIGPGSLSQSPEVPVATTANRAEIIELPERPSETATADESALASEAAMILAMASAPAPTAEAKPLKEPKPVAAEPVPAMQDAIPVPAAKKLATPPVPTPKITEVAAKKQEDLLLTLADEPGAASLAAVPNSDKEWSGTFTTFGEKPRSGFNFFKVLVPVGLAAVLALTAWLYTTKWRQANAEPMQASTPQNTQPVIDPITAASQAQTAAATNIPAPLPENSKNTGEIQPASLSTAPAAAKPMAPKTEDSEVEVETSGPKPLVVQNAGALPQARLAEPARAEAPQLIAAAGAIPVPALDVKGSLPKLQAKQSSLIPNQLMRSVPPVYPETARRLGLKGAVTVEAQVAPDGSVKSVKALDGEPLLAKAAETAVKQWKYRPSYLNGEPVASTARIVLNFKPPAQ